MKRTAILMIVAGLVLAVVALATDVSVAAPGMSYQDPLLSEGRVANWDLIGQREVLAVYAAALFVSGWIALAIDALRVLAKPAADSAS